MDRYAILINHIVNKIIEIDDGDELSKYVPEEQVGYDLDIGFGSILIPDEYDDVTMGYMYKDNTWRPPKPDPTYRWSVERSKWIYDKKLDKPVGNKHIWSDTLKDWKQVIFTYKEFINELFFNNSQIIKKSIKSGNETVEEIDDYLRDEISIDIRKSDIKTEVERLTTEVGGKLLTVERFNDIFV